MPKFSDGHYKKILGYSGDVSGSGALGTIYYQGTIDLYDGTPPADANDAITTQTFIGRITLNGGAFVEGIGTNGLVFDPPVISGTGTSKKGILKKPDLAMWAVVAGTLSGTKTATWGRLRGNATDAAGLSTDLPRIQLTVSDSMGNGELQLTGVAFVTGTTESVGKLQIEMT